MPKPGICFSLTLKPLFFGKGVCFSVKQPIFTGSGVAIVTPFDRETVDLEALGRLLDF